MFLTESTAKIIRDGLLMATRRIRRVPLKILRAQICSNQGRIYVPIEETPHFEYLQERKGSFYHYLKSFFYNSDLQKTQGHLDRFLQLNEELQYGKRSRRGSLKLITVQKWGKYYVILNGVHRASILKFRGEKSALVRILTHREDLHTPNRPNHLKPPRQRNTEPQEISREILITACGASGTTYLVTLLRENGVWVTHDSKLGRDGIVTNACNGKEVWVYQYGKFGIRHYVLMKINIREFRRVIHIVRHPLLVLGSVVKKWNYRGAIWPHIVDEMKELTPQSPRTFETAARYWLKWNENLEKCSSHRFRFEDLLSDPNPLFSVLERRLHRTIDPTKKIGGSGTQLYPTWKQLEEIDASLAKEVSRKAQEYGYDL